jgi:hypothetical protein
MPARRARWSRKTSSGLRMAYAAAPEPPPSIRCLTRQSTGQWLRLGFGARASAAARRAGGGGSGRAGMGSLRGGKEVQVRQCRFISWAFRPGFGPGLFDPCACARCGAERHRAQDGSEFVSHSNCNDLYFLYIRTNILNRINN